METLSGTTSSNLPITGSPRVSLADFDAYTPLSVMGEKIASDMRFEKKLQRLYEERERKKNGRII